MFYEFETSVFNDNQRKFILDCMMDRIDVLHGFVDHKEAYKTYESYESYNIVKACGTLYNLLDIGSVLSVMMLAGCYTTDDVRNRLYANKGFYIDNYTAEEFFNIIADYDLKVYSKQELTDYLNAHNMLSKLLIEFWKEQAA